MSWVVVAVVTAMLGASQIEAAQLTLSWVDTSGGQASFSIERKTGTMGTYTAIGQQQPGATSYVDGSVAAGAGYCYRVRAFNAVGTSNYSNEACASVAAGFDVAVAIGGTGTGSVVSSPAGISCNGACSASYPSGTVVTLSATAASGATFSGWSGGGCSGTAPCTLTGNGSVLVNASFAALPPPPPPPPPPSTHRLEVIRNTRGGGGKVSSDPAAISCGTVCSAGYASGTVVTLTAVSEPGQTFMGWKGGGCHGTGTCTVTLTKNTSVWALFRSTARNGVR